MKDENQLLQQKLRAILRQKEPTVSMSQLMRTAHKETTDDDVFIVKLDDDQLQQDQLSKFVVNSLLSFLTVCQVSK